MTRAAAVIGTAAPASMLTACGDRGWSVRVPHAADLVGTYDVRVTERGASESSVRRTPTCDASQATTV